MLRRWISFALIVLMSAAILGTGCSDSKGSEAASAAGSTADSSDSSEKVLGVCYFSQMDTLNATVLSNFKRIHSDVNVKEKVLDPEDFDSFQLQFQAELAAGQGADVIFLPAWCLPNDYKLMRDGVLCDLSTLISEDEELKIENYNKTILDTGIYDGKRYIIPIDYCFSYFYTYKTVMGDLKLETSNWTWDDLLKAAKEYFNSSNGKYFLEPDFNFWDMKYSDKNSYVNYDKKTSNFNSEGFIKLLQTYKELLPYVCPNEAEQEETDSEERIKLSVLRTENYTGVVKNAQGVVKPFNEEPIFIPYPTLDGVSNVNAFATNIAAITSKCKYKEEAFDYIKILLSTTIQNDETFNAPVMKSVFEEQSKTFKPVSESKTSITNIFGKINSCTLGDGSVDEIIKAELPAFVSGNKTAEQTAKAIDEKVNAYLKE
ncbi:ABC-type glycerol-3-phosphate transport system substrate-binding protein [Ruminiclostridium sufflavum DSM 19573]|uniref:ABC-type glycerol-3-phosphate transport system substrate-binding protein n=1 Tax=Ruminiclostridium sufflavum DSM 19573 TaxID=1121337 RepID=A0A318XS29_9FIRM|nr:ABC transporter substrate-binding protein [Ruminiclostridium sufflavum]PYG84360.1 ABC-type glycerol-3-phosphate transport system substrate-binding protein [Ruminiclostridium sufflavum DSM 19573]